MCGGLAPRPPYTRCDVYLLQCGNRAVAVADNDYMPEAPKSFPYEARKRAFVVRVACHVAVEDKLTVGLPAGGLGWICGSM